MGTGEIIGMISAFTTMTTLIMYLMIASIISRNRRKRRIRMKIKSSVALVLIVLLTFFVVGCKAKDSTPASVQSTEGKAVEVVGFGEKNPEDYNATLVLMAHSKQLGDVVDRFMEKYPNIKVEWDLVPGSEHLQAITSRVNTQELPDIMTFKTEFAKFITNIPNCYANLSEAPYDAESIAKKMVPYTVGLSRDNDGNLRGLSWQATVGGIYYRRSLAKEYFGTDDPEEINKIFSSWDNILEAARELKEKSNGEIAMFPEYEKLSFIFNMQRDMGWVGEDGKLHYDRDVLEEYFNLSKTLYEEDLVSQARWADELYFKSMKDNTAFAYCAPTWASNFVILPNAPETFGDWGLALPPAPYFRGGTFLGISHNTKHPEEAWLLFDFILNDTDSLMQYGIDDGDYVANMEVQQAIAALPVDEVNANAMMGGQNVYAFYNKLIEKPIRAELVSEYDATIDTLYELACRAYAEEGKTLEEAIKQFEDEVYSLHPELK